MIIRSRAPLRLGLAGGGTDVSPFSEQYGGAVLNATVNLFAYANLELISHKQQSNTRTIINKHINNCASIECHSFNSNAKFNAFLTPNTLVPIKEPLILQRGTINRIWAEYGKQLGPLLNRNQKQGETRSLRLTTYVDAPAGSGLGTSSTLVVAIVGAFAELLRLPLGEYDIAHLAYEIERVDIGMSGGKQDQYAATFGGVNFMEFSAGDKVVVNPLRIKREYINELESNLILYYTGTSRLSSKIIDRQSQQVVQGNQKAISAMKKLKEQSVLMKEAFLKGNINEIGEILDFGWRFKKQMTDGISNALIEEIYHYAKKAGATGGKITGAGGGGFMMLYCPGTTKYKVIERIGKYGGEFKRYQFTDSGLVSWRGLSLPR
jgi:D-glycero-alpha-D-manno-heptose-7-phosphate kinase